MNSAKKGIRKTIYENGLGTWLQWEYSFFQAFVITLFLGLGLLFLNFDPRVENPVYYPSWMRYWLALVIFLLLLDLLMLFQMLYFYTYRLVQYGDKYKLEYYKKGQFKELDIHEFYYWWSYGWSVMEQQESDKNMNLWEWLSSPAEKTRYKQQTILFVGMINKYDEQVLLFQVLNQFESVPEGWPFKKGTRMMNGIKALRLKGLVDAVKEL